jgi:hypothetical protein
MICRRRTGRRRRAVRSKEIDQSVNENLSALLEPMARVIAQQLAGRPEHFITHPAELRLFQSLSDDELRRFAGDHGWSVVRRIGGRQIEFYNDAQVQREAAEAGDLPGDSRPIR